MACGEDLAFRAGRDDDEDGGGGEFVGEFCLVAVLCFSGERGEREIGLVGGLCGW